MSGVTYKLIHVIKPFDFTLLSQLHRTALHPYHVILLLNSSTTNFIPFRQCFLWLMRLDRVEISHCLFSAPTRWDNFEF